MKNRSD